MESVFRFGADVRSGDDPREAQLRLIRVGEAMTPEEAAVSATADEAEQESEHAESSDATDNAEEKQV